MHAEVGESRDVLSEGLDQDSREAIQALLKNYASGQLADAAFEEDRNRFCRLTGLSSEEVGSEVRHADNLWNVARELRQAVEHGRVWKTFDLDFDIVIGRASGVRTEAQFNTVDRIVEKLVEPCRSVCQ